MRTVIKLIITLTLVLSQSIGAQDFQGVATYKTQRKLNFKMDSTKVTSDMQKKLMDMMKKQFQKTFKLTFTKEASIYKEEESLDKPQVGLGGGMQIVTIGSGGGGDVLYKNTKQQRFANQADTYGKIFLIKDSIKPIKWTFGTETKFIGEYQCLKATYTREKRKPRVIVNDEASDSEEEEVEEIVVTAWYTPQIPINNGPAMYQGLPGLILEIHDDTLNIVCSKIVLNPEDKIEIKEPEKGKEVSQEKYDEIMEKKAKEMMERYAPKKGSRKGESISISFDG